ncbi:MAG: hypothetical protein ABI472_09730 [Ginsengibacter sp.]
MKKYLIALSVFTIMAVGANAQAKNNLMGSAPLQHSQHMHHGKAGYGMHRHHKGVAMMKELNLTDAQKQQAKSLNTEYKNQLKDLEKNESITLKDYRIKKASLEQERKSKFQALLTADQKDKIALAKKDRSEHMKMMAQKKIERMKTELNLTDAQVSKIQEQRGIAMTQAKAIKEDASLTNEQKKEQLMSLVKSSKESMKNIFTAEQLKKREEMRNSRINDMKNKRANKDS